MEPWGKTDGAERHHLAHHCADVAMVLEGLLASPIILGRLGVLLGRSLDAAERALILRWAYLHDIGKLAPGFQAKGWVPGLWKGPTESHLEAGHDWFRWRARAMPTDIVTLSRNGDWYGALFAHHGSPVAPSRSGDQWRRLAHYDWEAGEAQVLKGLAGWFPAQTPEAALPNEPRLIHFLAGLLALADWIGSDREWFDFVAPFHQEYGVRARRRAAQALEAIGLSGAGRPGAEPGFAELTGHARANEAQAAAALVPGEERLVILEAETGSGKTEAALWRFARLWAQGQVDGLYFALPTRAAAAQVQERVRDALHRWLGDAAPETLLAVPGQLRVDDHEGYRLPEWQVLWDDGVDRRRWAAEHATRFLAARIAVGTVDQAMMAALQVKHAPMRAAALARSFLVVDEVHASDAYMRPILRRLLSDHVALGGHAMLMSATLGAVARADWLSQARPALEKAASLPYPAVWTRRERVAVAGTGRSKSVEVRPLATMAPEVVAAEAVAAAKRGARVLVIRNTVDMAVRTWEAVAALAPDLLLQINGGPALHHARFAAEDRRRLDRAVEAALGKQSPNGGVVVIGTQTLEQALDIDADLLLADLCPMDVLLQRIGRLHRHRRDRPAGFGTARAVVMTPEGGLGRLAVPAFENGLGAWLKDGTVQGIYTDLAGLEAVRRSIGEGTQWCIPALNRRLVEGATHPEALAAIVTEMGWEAYQDQVVAREAAMGMQGGYVAYGKRQGFAEGFAPLPDDSVVRTRLGGEGAVYALPPGTFGPFGAVITQLALPAHWSHGLTGEEKVAVEPEGEDLVFATGSRRFHYGRQGLQKAS